MKTLALQTKDDVRSSVLKHVGMLALIILGVVAAYSEVSTAYFCAYDDFLNIRHAAFVDAHQPSLVITTSHWNSFKYRPLNSAMTLFTYWLGGTDARFFRIRNLGFHLANVALVYTLSWLFFRSATVSAVGAALFGIHPLANQSIVGACWTNTMAHFWFLLALVMFIVSSKAPRGWVLWLGGALFSAWLSLLSYDSAIVVFGLMALYLSLIYFSGFKIERKYLLVFALMVAVLVGSYFVLRALFVPHGLKQAAAELPSFGEVSRNVVMYAAALASPIDPVLANDWMHVPLPSEIVFAKSTLSAIGLAVVIVCVLALLRFCFWLKRVLSAPRADNNLAVLVFLTAAVMTPLLPVLLFSGHPSETYLYLPVAFWCILLSQILVKLLSKQRHVRYFYCGLVLVLMTVFGAGTMVRNRRVTVCGETSNRILQSLPWDLLRTGAWTLSFASVPGEQMTRRYGFYGFRGVDTIGHGDSANVALTAALQLVGDNPELTGRVVPPEEVAADCRDGIPLRHIPVWVHSDGVVESCSPLLRQGVRRSVEKGKVKRLSLTAQAVAGDAVGASGKESP